jgi:5-methyltetrahydropteroyltriglutamate--homocysteine methyltransferase
MRKSENHILTTHVGSLPRPAELIGAKRAGTDAPDAFAGKLRTAVTDVVRRQTQAGIDTPSDGEFGKSVGHMVNYGAWWSYSFQRLSGLELKPDGLTRTRRDGELVLTDLRHRRDRQQFGAAYADSEFGVSMGPDRVMPPTGYASICAGEAGMARMSPTSRCATSSM